MGTPRDERAIGLLDPPVAPGRGQRAPRLAVARTAPAPTCPGPAGAGVSPPGASRRTRWSKVWVRKPPFGTVGRPRGLATARRCSSRWRTAKARGTAGSSHGGRRQTSDWPGRRTSAGRGRRFGPARPRPPRCARARRPRSSGGIGGRGRPAPSGRRPPGRSPPGTSKPSFIPRACYPGPLAMISFSRISKQYGRQVLFVDASFQLNPGEKVGLVGPERRGQDHPLPHDRGRGGPRRGRGLGPEEAHHRLLPPGRRGDVGPLRARRGHRGQRPRWARSTTSSRTCSTP